MSSLYYTKIVGEIVNREFVYLPLAYRMKLTTCILCVNISSVKRMKTLFTSPIKKVTLEFRYQVVDERTKDILDVTNEIN